MKFFQKALSGIKKVVNNKVFAAVSGGLAVVFPAVGIPLTAGVAITKKVTDGLKSADPKIREQAQAVVKNTATLAKQGDVGAKRAVALMKLTNAASGNTTPEQQAAAKEKLARLAMAYKIRQARGKQVIAGLAITKQGRIVNKKTRRNLSELR